MDDIGPLAGDSVLKGIIDDSYADLTINKRCKFKGCITLLNQRGIKESPFCCVHHRKVIRILDRGTPYSKEVQVYADLMKEASAYSYLD